MGSAEKEEINVLKHGLVPDHRLLSREEEKETLEELDVGKENLPKILKSDPAIKHLEKVHGDINVGRVVEVKRKSRTAGIATAYRLVVKRE
ncbi:MAG: DNA-directed RNA polymerase subunit H [Candidatus Thermoplasmatota archaeon]|nr:DNA-directed RNA polymerase subunit H [Candidatus Thermoplasmatota archaeon]